MDSAGWIICEVSWPGIFEIQKFYRIILDYFKEVLKCIVFAFFTSQAQNVFDPSKDSHEILEEFLSESWIALDE